MARLPQSGIAAQFVEFQDEIGGGLDRGRGHGSSIVPIIFPGLACRLSSVWISVAIARDLAPVPMIRYHNSMGLSASPPRSVTAIYPGSFDPITNGHLDVISRGA